MHAIQVAETQAHSPFLTAAKFLVILAQVDRTCTHAMGKKASAKAPAAPKAGKAKAKPKASTKSKAGGETPEAAGGQAPGTVINLVNDDVNTGHNAMVTAAIGKILAHPLFANIKQDEPLAIDKNADKSEQGSKASAVSDRVVLA